MAFQVIDETYSIFITNKKTIEQVFAVQRGESRATIPSGRLLRGSVPYNQPWSWQTTGLPSAEAMNQHLLRATSGSGIVNLHHTITRYAIERVRHLLSEAEYAHMIAGCIEFMGAKSTKAPPLLSPGEALSGYSSFQQSFSKRHEVQILSYLKGMLPSEKARRSLGRYLIKGVCDLYQGDYNPHFLTGLGCALWVMDNYWNQPPIAVNAMRQYLSYYFTDY